MRDVLDTPIEFLRGVGPQRGELLRKELDIHTFGDLLAHFPFRHVDRTRFHRLADLNAESGTVQVRGVLGPLRSVGGKGMSRLVAAFSDGTATVELVWFKGVRWLQGSLKPGQPYVLYGKPTWFNGRPNFAHPELEPVGEGPAEVPSALQPVYRQGAGQQGHLEAAEDLAAAGAGPIAREPPDARGAHARRALP
jgi:ATP-dependent DNA helicase RecG